jgi:endogenous inhibitor of DNA gyrase (YacG/DUF329 family)
LNDANYWAAQEKAIPENRDFLDPFSREDDKKLKKP